MSKSREQPDANTVFLVSGGAKGITAQCVIRLAQRYQSKFVLVGRSSYNEEPEPVWSRGLVDDVALKQAAMHYLSANGQRPIPAKVQDLVKAILSQREIMTTLQAVERAGGRALYISADVTDGATLCARVMRAVVAQDWTITGIIHGAGTLADKLIEKKTPEDFERVYAVKVHGLENLLACVAVDKLSYVVLFSSVAGFYGNMGQSDYAIANEILNKAAYVLKRKYPACRVLSVNWGPWDGGMVTPGLKKVLEQRGVMVIPVDTGADILADMLVDKEDGDIQVVVGGALRAHFPKVDGNLRAYRIHRQLRLEANPFLHDHVIGGHAVLPTVCAVGWVANACEQLHPGYHFFRAENYRALKGIVFDETLATEYVLDLRPVVENLENEIVFDAVIWSKTDDGKTRYHYSVQVTLRHKLPPAPFYDDFDLEHSVGLMGTSLYENLTLFHGPSFRGVQRVLNLGLRRLTMRCVLSEVKPYIQGQFPVQGFNPYVTDVQLQGLLVWARHFHQLGGLPLRIQSAEQFRPIEFGELTYVSMEVQSHSRRSLVADVNVHDARGCLYSRILGAEITLSARLNQLFQQNQLC